MKKAILSILLFAAMLPAVAQSAQDKCSVISASMELDEAGENWLLAVSIVNTTPNAKTYTVRHGDLLQEYVVVLPNDFCKVYFYNWPQRFVYVESTCEGKPSNLRLNLNKFSYPKN